MRRPDQRWDTTDVAHVIARVASGTDLAPVASETSLAPVTRTPERISALVKSAFADVRGIDGEAPYKAPPGAPPPCPPETVFVPEITPPLPVQWPAELCVYYAYARQFLGGDAERVSEPWARIESGSELVLVPLSGQLKLLGTQGVNPATVSQRMVFDEGARATPLEDLLVAAGQNAAVATLVRKSYCSWQSHNRIAKAVLPWHPNFAAFLDCANVDKKLVPRLQTGAPTARPSNSREGGYANAQAAYKRGDYKAAFDSMTEAAEEGNADAQYRLGLMYANGRGVAKDEKTAVLWYAKAAEQGNAPAQYNLGVRYANGQGVAKDENTALLWYGKAALHGDSDAQYALGWMCANGRGMAKDEKAAVGWYTAAADHGNAQAQCNLGVMYDSGQGVEKDEKAAVLWYTPSVN